MLVRSPCDRSVDHPDAWELEGKRFVRSRELGDHLMKLEAERKDEAKACTKIVFGSWPSEAWIFVYFDWGFGNAHQYYFGPLELWKDRKLVRTVPWDQDLSSVSRWKNGALLAAVSDWDGSVNIATRASGRVSFALFPDRVAVPLEQKLVADGECMDEMTAPLPAGARLRLDQEAVLPSGEVFLFGLDCTSGFEGAEGERHYALEHWGPEGGQSHWEPFPRSVPGSLAVVSPTEVYVLGGGPPEDPMEGPATPPYLMRFDGERWTDVDLPFSGYATVLEPTAHGDFWVATSALEVWLHTRGSAWRRLRAKKGATPAVSSIAWYEGVSRLWLFTDKGPDMRASVKLEP